MNSPAVFKVRRKSVASPRPTVNEAAEIQHARKHFQQKRPTLTDVLKATGQRTATTLAAYLLNRELLMDLKKERERQRMTLSRLGQRSGIHISILSRLFSGQQPNTTLATVARIATALGKTVTYTLVDLPRAAKHKAARKAARSTRNGAVNQRMSG